MACSCGMRGIVWAFWAVNTFLSSVYIALALTSFYNIEKNNNNMTKDSRDRFELQVTGLKASTLIGFIIVLLYIIYSFLILITRMFADVKASFGFLMGSCLHIAWFQLLAGLVLQNGSDFMSFFSDNGYNSRQSTQTYQATFAFSYLLVLVYLLNSIILFFGRNKMSRGSDEEPAPNTAYVDMQAFKATSSRQNQV